MAKVDQESDVLRKQLKTLRELAARKSTPDMKLNQRIAELESQLGSRTTANLMTPTLMNKGGSVIKKSGSKAAKAGVTKFSPVKTITKKKKK